MNFNHKKISKFFYKAIHILEYMVAVITMVALVILLGYEIYKMATVEGYFASADFFLQNVLTIVVGLEFVRMLINLTPANILEVLIVAIARQVIISHDGALSNVASVLCIAGLFAIRKYLVAKHDYKKDFADEDDDEENKSKKESE